MIENEASDAEPNTPPRWSANDPDLVIRCQPATAVYENNYGMIVICQEAGTGDANDDMFVQFERHHLPALINKLKEYV